MKPSADSLLKNIFERCQRSVRTLELYATHLDEVPYDLLLYQLHFPKLLEVRLSSDEKILAWPVVDAPLNNGVPEIIRITTFRDTPNLRTMICNSEGIIPILTSYSSLTCLLIERVLNTTEWLGTIRHLLQLEIGLFHLTEDPSGSPNVSVKLEVFSLRNLKRLYIYHTNEFHCAPLQSFEFPALEDFRLYIEDLITSPEVLYWTMPNVRHFAIRCSDSQGIDHIPPLKNSLQNVQEFECSADYQDLERLFMVLSATTTSRPLFPYMRKITIRVTTEWEGGIFSRHDINQSILTRWKPAQVSQLIAPLNYMRFIIKDETGELASRDIDDLLGILNLDTDDDAFSERFTWEVGNSDSEAVIEEDILDLENTCGIKFRYERIQ